MSEQTPSSQASKNDTVDVGPLYTNTLDELTQTSAKLARLIPLFSKLDVIYVLVHRTAPKDQQGPIKGLDHFYFACIPDAEKKPRVQAEMLSLPYGKLLDNLYFFSEMAIAQTACDQMNRSQPHLNMVPRTPSMVFFEQKSEIDRLLAELAEVQSSAMPD